MRGRSAFPRGSAGSTPPRRAWRAFCGLCGTPLTWEAHAKVWDRPIVEFHISTLDDPDAFVPDRHWFHGERIAWFEVADDLPRYRELEGGEAPYHRGPVSAGRPGGKK